MQGIWDWFRWLHDTTGINLTIFYDAFDRHRFADGVLMSIKLSVICIVLSVLIGVLGAWLQGSRLRFTRHLVHWYIQFFRNTPPLVQLYFFYFGVGSLLSTLNAAGTPVPLVTQCHLGDHLAVVLRGRVQRRDLPLGHRSRAHDNDRSRGVAGLQQLRTYLFIVLPLAFRISLPALNNNLVNLVKTTTTRVCDRRAGDAVRVQPDLVG